jgi:O-antigen/teichoic acid export membrane protein
VNINSININSLGKGFSYSFIGKFFGRFTNALVQIVLARFLGPEIFGLYAIGWTLFRIINMISPLGLDQGVMKFGAEDQNQERDTSVFIQGIGISLFSGIIFFLLLFFLSPWLAIHIFKKTELVYVFRWFAIGLPIAGILRVVAASTLVSKDVKYSMLSEEISQPVSNLVLIILFYWIGLGIIGALASAILSFVIALFMVFYFFRRLYPEIFRKGHEFIVSNRKLLSFSIASSLGITLSFLITMNDRFLLGLFRTEYEVGIYQAIITFSLVFVTLLSAVKTIFAPMVSGLFNSKDIQNVRNLFSISTKWSLYIGIPMAIIILVFSNQLISVLFGKEYVIGSTALVIITVGQLINIATGPIDIVLIMGGHQKDWMVITGIMFLFNIAANLLLIPKLGIMGAAISLSITLTMLYLSGILRAMLVLKLSPYDRRYIKSFVSAVPTFIVMIFISQLNMRSDIFFVLLGSIVSFSIYWAIIMLLGLDQEDRQILSFFKARLQILIKGN